MKKIWLTLLACVTFVCVALATSCSLFEDKTKIAFNEGYLEEIVLGDPIMLDEYVNPDFPADYSVTLTCDETGKQRDLKALGQWTTDYPGIYTLTYTIHNGDYKGKISTKISVVVPEITWSFSKPTLAYRAGDTMSFAVLQRNLNVMVKSYYDYNFFVETVTYGDKREDVSTLEEYTFPEEGSFTFTFGVKSEDGQELTADQVIKVRPQQVLAEGAQEWMDENNITAYDYTYISPDGKVSLEGGYYSSIINDNVPYIAFNGEEGVGYGSNTYIMVDFTGKNLPQVAFFCNEVTPSFTDGTNGILLTNGITNNNGTDYYKDKLNMSRLTIFGPRKVSYPEFDNKGRMLATGSVADPCPMSYHALSESDSYRYIVGIEDGQTNSVVVRILLINTTTSERVFDYKQKLTTYSGPAGNLPLDLSDDYFKGSIVLYGRYGVNTEWDKVHMPITGISDIYELDRAASFKDGYKTQYDLNTTVSVSDYIDIPDTDYEFKVFDPNGNEVTISEIGTFKYTLSGKYILRFEPKQEGLRASAISVRVMYDLENALPVDQLEADGAIMGSGDTGVSTNENKKFIKEGEQSIQNYSINGTDSKITIYVSRSFMDFIFISRMVKGITFEVYSDKAATFQLENKSNKVVEDYTGEIPAGEWTTLTISRDLCLKNADAYTNTPYSLAIVLSATGEGEKFYAREYVYIDNVQLIVNDVKPTISEGAQEFMEENNIEAYGYNSINDDMQVNLQEGIYQQEWWKIANDDVPYIGYRGNYGAGSYVVVDFTGKNVPQLTFFAESITSSITDGKEGLYIHTGMVKKNDQLVSDTDGGRITFLGPNKMEYCRPDSSGRVGKQFGTKAWDENGVYDAEGKEVSPLSIRGLEDGVHYRLVAGIKTACVESNTKGRIVIELLLINLDTNEEVIYYEWSEATEGLYNLIDGGNIILYSRFNEEVTFDKIYAVYEGVSDIKAIDKVSEVLGE